MKTIFKFKEENEAIVLPSSWFSRLMGEGIWALRGYREVRGEECEGRH